MREHGAQYLQVSEALLDLQHKCAFLLHCTLVDEFVGRGWTSPSFMLESQGTVAHRQEAKLIVQLKCV